MFKLTKEKESYLMGVDLRLSSDNAIERRFMLKQRHVEFKAELFAYYDVADNPKAERLYELAYERGHASGFHEVVYQFDELVDLIT